MAERAIHLTRTVKIQSGEEMLYGAFLTRDIKFRTEKSHPEFIPNMSFRKFR